jgi:hypothetical protein
MDRYNTQIQERADATVWVSNCHSWYKNEHGKVTNNWPAFTVSYWKRMRDVRPYEFSVGVAGSDRDAAGG